jgi:lipopolysaccharide export system permease protein
MKLVDKQVLRETVAPFLFGVTAFSSVFFAGTYMLKLTQWIMNGMPVLTALQIVVLYLPGIVFYTLPMATLLAVLLGVGRLSSDSEVVGLFAGGVSIYRLAAPIVCLGIIISGCSVALNELIAPWATQRSEQLQEAVLKLESKADKSFSLRDEETDSLINVSGMDVNTGVLKNVTIIKFLNKRLVFTLDAKRAEWKGMNDSDNKYRWRFYDGVVLALSPETGTFVETRFGETQLWQIHKTPTEMSLFQKEPEEMNFGEISSMVNYLKQHPDRPAKEIRELDVGRWNKLALPLSSLVFAMLATPVAFRPQRSSSSVGLGLSMFLIFVYWMVWNYTSSMAIDGSLEPVVGAFAADVLGIGAALALLKRAAK